MADTIDQALLTALLANADIASMVRERVYPIILPQPDPDKLPDLPAITIARIDAQRDYVMEGASGTVHARYQVDCWANRYRDAVILGGKVRTLFSGFHGAMSGIDVQGIFLMSDNDSYENETKIYRWTQDYQVNHLE